MCRVLLEVGGGLTGVSHVSCACAALPRSPTILPVLNHRSHSEGDAGASTPPIGVGNNPKRSPRIPGPRRWLGLKRPLPMAWPRRRHRTALACAALACCMAAICRINDNHLETVFLFRGLTCVTWGGGFGGCHITHPPPQEKRKPRRGDNSIELYRFQLILMDDD